MTIKELCDKNRNCDSCPFVEACAFNFIWSDPISDMTDKNAEKIAKAIIETANLLQENDNESVS